MTRLGRRRERAAALIRGAGLDAAAFVPGPSFHYLTGLDFPLMERPTLLFVTEAGGILAIMPELERLKWSSAFPDAETFYWQDSDGFEDAFEAATRALGAAAVGVEGGRMRMFEYDALRRRMGNGDVRNADAALQALRIAKDEDEIASLTRAIEISELALAETLDEVRAGDTEQAIAALLKTRMLAHGSAAFGFDPIVLAGANAANPHGTPGETALGPGDALLIDFGAKIDGFSADITRTFFCEHVSERHGEIYETVREANALGRRVAGPGVTAHDLDSAVTGVLRASPFADLIVHKTGHGLGLDVHEAPQVMVGNHQALEPGYVITIEPGLYGAGDVGVRIEDDVTVTEDGARALTSFPRELRLIG